MEFKKSIIILITAIFLVSIAGVCASDANDTLVASENTNQIEISDSDKTIEDNLQTSEENTKLAVDENDETLSSKTDSEILTADQFTYSNLREQIGSGGNINLTKGTYTYNGDGYTIEITTSGVINGNGAVIDMAQSGHRAFNVATFGVTIKNLTIKNANYNGMGGAIYFSSSGTVTNCNFTNNTASNDGGAVYFDETGNVSNCNFAGNNATGDGGAINMVSGSVSNCNFTANTANDEGGAVYFWDEGTVTNCNFAGNTASGDGGAVWIYSGTVTNCNFTDNSASAEGGAIYSFLWSTADTCIFKSSDTTFNIGIFPPTLNVDNFTTFYGSGEKLTFDLKTYSNMTVNNGNISISVYYKNNDSWVGNYSCLSGEGWTVDLPIGYYYANFTTEYAGFQTISRTITISKAETELTAKAVTATYNSNKKLIITLKDVNGKPLNGVKLTVKIKSDKTYTTDKNGQVKVNVGKLVPKTYNVKIIFKGNNNFKASQKTVKVTVKKAASKITAKKKTFKKSVKIKKYTVILKSGKTPIKKAKLTLKIKGKTFKAKTNKKGKATFKIKLAKKAKYKGVVTFKGNKYYKKVTKKVKITIK